MEDAGSTEALHNADEGMETRPRRRGRKGCQPSPLHMVCVSHAFSAWGDRMWQFAVGLYLVELTPGSLRLTAIYQLVKTVAVILFGPFVGDWVDASPRLRVAQISLVIQNSAVICSAAILLLLLLMKESLSLAVYGLLEALIIIIGSVAQISSIGTKIAVERDWVVVMAGSDKDLLAGTNAILRRIDLSCKILAPVLVGQIMTYISKVAGVVFIASWNLVSVFLEYYLLLRVFRTVTALSKKVTDTAAQQQRGSPSCDPPENSVEDGGQGSTDRLNWMEGEADDSQALVPTPVVRAPERHQTFPGLNQWKKRMVVLKKGWRLYMKQRVARPGLALASLYFTVLSFGAVATGYAYTQHLSESLLSILRGVGSFFGILATFLFPPMRNRIGLVRTGLFSMSGQFSCLLFCAAAVFAPGSPSFFLPSRGSPGGVHVSQVHPVLNTSCYLPPSRPSAHFLRMDDGDLGTVNTTNSTLQPSVSIGRVSNTSTLATSMPTPPTVHISTAITTTTLPIITHTAMIHSSITAHTARPNCTVFKSTESPASDSSFSYTSIVLLLTGIVTSRLGLWLSDLAITQLQQETIPEQERGIVGGMQRAFQSAMDLIMFGLVIALPKPEDFGLLTLLSVAAVGLGAVLYASYAYRERGHLFHFDKLHHALCVGTPARRPLRSASEDTLDLDDEEDAMIQGVLTTRNENFSY